MYLFSFFCFVLFSTWVLELHIMCLQLFFLFFPCACAFKFQSRVNYAELHPIIVSGPWSGRVCLSPNPSYSSPWFFSHHSLDENSPQRRWNVFSDIPARVFQVRSVITLWLGAGTVSVRHILNKRTINMFFIFSWLNNWSHLVKNYHHHQPTKSPNPLKKRKRTVFL